MVSILGQNRVGGGKRVHKLHIYTLGPEIRVKCVVSTHLLLKVHNYTHLRENLIKSALNNTVVASIFLRRAAKIFTFFDEFHVKLGLRMKVARRAQRLKRMAQSVL